MALARRALDHHAYSDTAVQYIKKHFQDQYSGVWSVIVGNCYSTSVTDDFEAYIHVQVGYCDIVIFSPG